MVMEYKVVTFYRFVAVDDLPTMRATIKAACTQYQIHGSILLAPEGINATIAAQPELLDKFMLHLNNIKQFTDIECKYSSADKKPFKRMKVKLKKELISYKQPSARPECQVGTYVDAKDWNALISDPDVTVVDTRNTYETAIGMFKGAQDPKTTFFTQLPEWVQRHLNPKKNKKIAMYCTGGIRCEKSTSHMLALGYDEVYHLKGGILKYLEDIPEEESLWEGECFVFDERVSLTHGLKQGQTRICYGCGHPLSPEETQHEAFELAVSCQYCIEDLTPKRRQILEARHANMIRMKKAKVAEQQAS